MSQYARRTQIEETRSMLARLMGLKTISPDDLHRLAQNPGQVSVIDVNSRQSWMEARVPGARNLDRSPTRTVTSHQTRTPPWCSIVPIRGAGKLPMRPVEQRRWAIAM